MCFIRAVSPEAVQTPGLLPNGLLSIGVNDALHHLRMSMDYTFELLGVSPVLSFFSHQQDLQAQRPRRGAAYVASHRCTLDSFIDSVKTETRDREWNLDQAVDTVVSFWLKNGEQISYWKRRLDDAGKENLLVARLADVDALRLEFESLF